MAMPPPISPELQEDAAADAAPAGLNLAAVVLMAGSVRQTDLGRGSQRALLDLPIRADRSIGACWNDRVEELRDAWSLPQLPLVIAANVIAGAPKDSAGWRGASIRMDSEEARGSGGALKDAVRGLDPASHVLVAPGHAFVREPLAPLLDRLSRLAPRADVVIHASMASVPSGFFLIRCGALSGVSSNGFADLKEQVLPQLARQQDVRVVRCESGLPFAVRSLESYIKAARAAADTAVGSETDLPPEDWRCTFALAEPGADVHPSARLHDSVVLAGSRVGEGALLVRSLVGPGGVVAPGEAMFDRIIAGEKP